MRRPLLCFCCCFCVAVCTAQKGYGIGQDYYLYRKRANSFVPSVYYQAANDWYGQVRYNYEEEQTLSVHAGKQFAGEGLLNWSVIPQAGLLAGRFTGGSLNVQAELQAGPFGFMPNRNTALPLATMAKTFLQLDRIVRSAAAIFYTGIAVQQTKLRGEKLFAEPGIVFGIDLKNIELPFYFFKPKAAEGYFVVGVHWKLK